MKGPSRHTPLRVAFARPWPGTRRGLCLWLLGIGVALVGGVNYMATDLPDSVERSLWFPLSLTGGDPTPIGVIMLAAGAAAVFASYCHFGRDKIGYVIVAMTCTGLGCAYLVGPFGGGGGRSIGSAVIWLIFAGLAVAISGFPNVRLGDPPPVVVEPDEKPTGGGQ